MAEGTESYCLNAFQHLLTFERTGSGTYSDPISFGTASDNKDLPQCAIIYVPLLRKYFRNEVDCSSCCKCLTDLQLRQSSLMKNHDPLVNDWATKGEYHINS